MTTMDAIKRVITKRKARGAKRSEICQYLNQLRRDTWKNNSEIYAGITNLIKSEVKEAIQ